MAGWRPLKRRDFIRKLRALGFDGPYSGTRHQFMISGQQRQTIPTNAEYSVPQIRLLLRQVESILARPISLDEWILYNSPNFWRAKREYRRRL